jgi:hypothetical protein
LKELYDTVLGAFHVKGFAREQIDKYEVLVRIRVEGNMAFCDDGNAGDPGIFRYLPPVSEYVWLGYFCHADLLGQIIQEIKAGIEVVEDVRVALTQIQHQVGAVSVYCPVHFA